jgi:hypothetical protein
MTRDLDSLVALLNPVPDPEAVVDPGRRDALLREILTAPAPAARRSRPRVLRLALAAATLAVATAVASALLLAGGENPVAPQRFAVLAALAEELQAPDRILHTRERTTVLGRPGAANVEETWTLLEDARYSRFRIGTGRSYEEGAMTPTGSSDYQPSTNTLTIVDYGSGGGGPTAVGELPVERLARAAAEGRVPVEGRVEIRGRAALKIRDGDAFWYVAADAPVLLRRDLEMPDGRVQRSDFTAFEILPATAENRQLLAIDPPPGAKVERVEAPPPPFGQGR